MFFEKKEEEGSDPLEYRLLLLKCEQVEIIALGQKSFKRTQLKLGVFKPGDNL